MALPRTLSNVAFPANQHHSRVYRSSGGNHYVVMRDPATTGNVVVQKSDNGDNTWAEQNAGSAPLTGSVAISTISVDQVGDVLHVIAINTSLVMYYSVFTMSSDTWTTVDTSSLVTMTTAATANVAIAARSDSDIVVVYQDTEKVHGTNYARIFYIYYDGATWQTTPVAVDAGGTTNYRYPSIVLGASDKTHITYAVTADVLHKSLTSGYSLSSVEVVDDITTDASQFNTMPRMVYYDTSGTERITITIRGNGVGTIQSHEIDNDGTPGTGNTITTSHKTSGYNVSSVVVNGTIVYFVFSDSSTSDLWIDQNDDSGGWGADTEILDAVTVNKVIAGVLTNDGGDVVIAYVYDDGGTIKYNEYVIVAGGTEYMQSVAGTQTNSGTIAKLPQKAMVGIQTNAGVIARFTSKAIAGVQTSAGIVVRQTNKVLAGVMTSAGTLVSSKIALVLLEATQTSAGTIARFTGKLAAGVSASAGELVRLTSKPIAGVQTSAGTVIKQAAKLLAGVSASAGSIATSLFKVVALAGVQTSAGTVVRLTSKILVGVQTSAGTISRLASKVLAGIQTSAGTVVENFIAGATVFYVSVAGSQTNAGVVIRQISKTLTGVQTSAGAVAKQISKLFTGIQTNAGVVATVRLFTRTLAGAQTSAGTLIKHTQKTLSGVMTSAGVIGKLTQKTLSGVMVNAGTVTKQIRKLFAGLQSMVGSIASVLGLSGVPGTNTLTIVDYGTEIIIVDFGAELVIVDYGTELEVA